MKTCVVYDSFFGNTQQVAQTLAQVLAAKGAQAVRVQDLTPDIFADLELLIVGSPTRAFSPSPVMKTWLKNLPNNSLQNINTAAFDTRIAFQDVGNPFLTAMVRMFGYAAETLAKQLKRKGGTPVLEPMGFIVTGTEGPLKDGELERAIAWAKQIVWIREM